MNADGTLKSVKDPNNQTVEYGYDEQTKRLENVSTTLGEKTYKNEYTYENNRLKTVKHNTTDNNCDVTYTFDYDALGRKTTVKIGNQVLSTNVYSDDRNGILKEVQYGNGGKVSYVYDDFDRITGVKHDGETSPRYTYEYGANGQAAFMKDVNLGRIHQTEYDIAERPVQATTRDTSGNLIYLDQFREKLVVEFETYFNGQKMHHDDIARAVADIVEKSVGNAVHNLKIRV